MATDDRAPAGLESAFTNGTARPTTIFGTGVTARPASARHRLGGHGRHAGAHMRLGLEARPSGIKLIALGFVDTPLSASILGDGLEARREELITRSRPWNFSSDLT